MILFLFSIFNMKKLFLIVSPPTFHLAPRSMVLLGPVLHLPIACTLLTLGRTLGVESVFASSPAQCIRLIVFLYTVYYQEWENTFSSTTARLPLRPFLQINVRVACLVTSYGVMGRKTTVFGSLFAKKKGMKRILNDVAAPQQHGRSRPSQV